MKVVPCSLCGYDAPGAACPHCAGSTLEPSLRRRLGGPLTGILDGVLAVPKGLLFLATTRGVKRWLVPPLLLTSALLVLALWWSFSFFQGLVESRLPGEFEFGDAGWAWLQELSERWDWLKASAGALVGAAEWVVNALWALLVSKPLRLLGWFLIGSLVAWYCFSIAYEALAGPFLDEIHARLETRWFGADPRSRLERPNDIPSARCARLTTLAAGLGGALLIGLALTPGVPLAAAFAAVPLGVVPGLLIDRRYGPWLAWIVRVEGRAAWASLQASVVTGVLIVLALPLYFVPLAGYFLFAMVTGFATAIGLLDIPFERRGWTLRQRGRFVLRNLPPLLAFGIAAGLLLSVPVIGPVLMVPAASIGGLWLICRLDKRADRPAESAPDGGG